MVKWGFIGCGAVTEKKSGPAFSKVEGSQVVAVMRRNEAKAKDYAARHHIPTYYTDADALINDPEVTAVYVATPPGLHAPYAIKALQAGKPVYIEKPLATSVADCYEIERVSRQTGIPCFVAYYRRTLPYFGLVKQMIDEGRLGDISSVQIRFALPPRTEDYNRENLPWRVRKELSGAGYFYDLASHQLDLLDYLLGPIVEAKGFSSNIAHLYDVEDMVAGAFKFENGILGSGSWSFVAPANVDRADTIEFVGTKARLICSSFQFTPIQLIAADGVETFCPENPDNIQYYLIQQIVRYLNHQTEEIPVSTVSSALRANIVMDKILGRI